MQRMLILVGIISLVLIGCQGDNPTPVTSEEKSRSAQMPADIRVLLELNAANETDAEVAAAGFGDLNDLNTDLWSNYDVYSLTIAWGELQSQHNPNLPGTDWSGSLTIEDGPGMVDVASEIDFEPGQDTVIPHNSAHFALWESVTNGDIDGLSFLVFLDRTNNAAIDQQVRFLTPLFELVLTKHQLAQFGAFYLVSNTQAVAVLSRQIFQNTCPGGFIKGGWVQLTNTGDSGYFHGIWFDRSNDQIGLMTARYWTNNDGTREYQGTISGVMTNVVLGEVNGVWAYDDQRLCPLCGIGHGWFRGRFLLFEMGDRPQQQGGMAGVFGDYALPVENRILPLFGVWKVDCPNSIPEVSIVQE